MRGPEHLGIGVASAGLVIWGAHAAGASLGLGAALTGAGIAGLGSLAPDIDHPRAMIGNRLPATLLSLGLLLLCSPLVLRLASGAGGMFAGVWTPALQWTAAWPRWGALLTAVSIALFFVSAKVTGSTDHRGPVHSLAAAGAATVVSVAVCWSLGLAPWFGLLFGLGWSTHLMADAITPAGLPCLFWPRMEPEGAGSPRVLGLLVVPLVILGVTGWFFSAQALLPSRSAGSGSVKRAPTDGPSNVNVPLAQQRLREAAPAIAGALTDPNSPVVAQNGASTSYTWQYLNKPAPDRVVVKTIKVTLDESGQIVGVEEQ